MMFGPDASRVVRGETCVNVMRWLVLAVSMSLSSCGGGGGGSGGEGGFTVSSQSLGFQRKIGGDVPASQIVSAVVTDRRVAQAGAAYLGEPPAAWLSITAQTRASDPSTVDFEFSIPPTSYLPAGEYPAHPHLGAVDSVGNVLYDVPLEVRYVVREGVLLQEQDLSLRMVEGDTERELSFTITAPDGLQYQLSSSASWLGVASSPGSGAGTAVARVRPSALPPGAYTGTLTATNLADPTDHDTLDVTLAVDADRLILSRHGVAFAAFQPDAAPTRALAVRRLSRRSGGWSAESDQSWLEVTPSGDTDTPLRLTARASGLASAATHIAQVTVRSTDPALTNVETLRVGLWTGADRAPEQTIELALNTEALSMAVNPVEPVVYVALRQPSPAVEAYHLYTGEKIARYPLASSVGPGGMAVSDDGTTLYLNGSSVGRIDLLTGQPGAALQLNSPDVKFRYGRVDGHPVLIAQNGSASDAESGADLDSLVVHFYGEVPSVAISHAGDRVYYSGRSSLTDVYDLQYSPSTRRLLGQRLDLPVDDIVCTNANDLAVTGDDARLYIPCYSENRFKVVDARSLLPLTTIDLPADTFAQRVANFFDGRAAGAAVRADGVVGYVYSAAGEPVGSQTGFGAGLVGFDVSGDGERLIGLTTDPQATRLQLRNVP